ENHKPPRQNRRQAGRSLCRPIRGKQGGLVGTKGGRKAEGGSPEGGACLLRTISGANLLPLPDSVSLHRSDERLGEGWGEGHRNHWPSRAVALPVENCLNEQRGGRRRLQARRLG